MIESIIFLCLFLGFPVIMTVLLIRILIRKLRSGSVYASIADEMGWQFLKDAEQHPITNILKNELFSIRRGTHRIINLLDSQDGFMLCEYHYFSPGPTRRRGNRYSLGIYPRRVPGENFWVIRRQDGFLGGAAEAAAGNTLREIPDKNWEWLLSPFPEQIIKAGWTNDVNKVLKEILPPGGALFFLRNHLILSWTGEMSKDRIPELKKALDKLPITEF